jgi:2-polyprenyl-3-methyl-5-hydroxy-6-metoxy-1,4-benzoquinol methylase
LNHVNADATAAATPLRNPQADGRICDLCGGREFSLLHEWPVGDKWNPASIPIAVWKCRCGLAFLHPVPEPHQLPDRGEWWSGQRRQFRRRGAFKEKWKAFRHAIVGSGKDRLLRSTRKAMPRGRFLDVGCGEGEMLTLAAKFYEPAGLEPSPIAAARTREKGFPVAEETLEETTLPAGSFDVILLDSVIEHVASPRAALQKVHELLAPGGVVVLLTPKFEGPSCRMHGREWNGFRHGYHTFLFSGQTLGRYLRETGFEVLRSPRRDRPLDDILILWGRKTA